MAYNDDLNYGETLRGLRQGMQVFGGRYVLKRRLGRGGMGEVWLAEDLELERDVALKFLPEFIARDPTAVRDLKREARRALDLTHENIVRVHDFLSDDYFAAISMEFVDGESLASLRSKHENGYFEWDEIKPWLPELFSALTYAHDRAGIVHRDLKPANILLARSGTLKIVDFGISSSITDTVSRVSIQSSSGGTPVYMSPQQMMGEDPSVADDIYSVGAIMYELLTGKPPFYSGNILLQVQSKVPPSVSERRRSLHRSLEPIPEGIESVIADCLRKQGDARPPSITSAEKRLQLAAPSLSVEYTIKKTGEETSTKESDPEQSEPYYAQSLPFPLNTYAKRWVAVSLTLLALVLVFVGGIYREKWLPVFSELNLGKVVSQPQEGENWIVSDLGLEMVWIAPGEFVMGSPTSEEERDKDELQRNVRLSNGYWLGKYEVTKGEWHDVMSEYPSGSSGQDKLLPIHEVSWEEAVEFCKILTKREQKAGHIPPSLEYRLPTEAQWEYACRAGRSSKFSFGEENSRLQYYGNFGDKNVAVRSWKDGTSDDGYDFTAPVGSYAPNDWGLHDMHGNLSEWCLDWYGSYSENDTIDPEGPSLGHFRILRGGNWDSSAYNCRSASRAKNVPTRSIMWNGFRLALVNKKLTAANLDSVSDHSSKY